MTHPKRCCRKALLAPLACAALLLVSSCSGASDARSSTGEPAASERITLRVGQIRSSLQPILEASGELRKLPYRLTWNSFATGPLQIEAQNVGALDLAYMADTPPIFAQAAGKDATIVGITKAPQGARNVALIVRADSAIHRVQDLRGRRIVVIPGTITQYLLIRVLAQAGIPYTDVNPVNLLAPEAVTALHRGDVDAIVLVDPQAASALATEPARVLLTGENLVSGSNVFVTRPRTLRDPAKAKAIGNLLTRVRDALDWARAHPREWAVKYAAVNKLPASVARATVERAATELVPIDADRIASQQAQADAFARLGLLPTSLDVTGEFDDRYNAALFTPAR